MISLSFDSDFSLDHFHHARDILKNIVITTPFIRSSFLSDLIQGDVFLKLENLQITHSFKPRGAYVKLFHLSESEKNQGIVAISAGNHAQGVAYHAKNLGIKTTIVMPTTTPKNKIKAVEGYGARIILSGNHLAESFEMGEVISQKENLTIIHPYDDPYIIHGQGTIGLEIIEQSPFPLDYMIIPVGGGGLASGISLVLKKFWPHTQHIGIQSEWAPSMASLLYGYEASSFYKNNPTIAEGITVKKPGSITSSILKETLSMINVVQENTIKSAIKALFLKEKIVVEGAGASGIAGLFEHHERYRGKKVGIIICGGNIDTSLFFNILQEEINLTGFFSLNKE